MPKLAESLLATALWASHDDDGQPLDDRFTVADLPAETITAAERMVDQFLADTSDYLAQACEDTGHDLHQAMHDFWLTAAGHGAGFWEREWQPYSDRLTAAADRFRDIDLTIGDDGRVYIFPSLV
jgi:hypothetical protein